MSKINLTLRWLKRAQKYLKKKRDLESTCCTKILESAKSLEKVNEKATKIMNKNVDDLYNDTRKWHG
jgi:hypothetical protein